ncbi:MAG: hypothetical protein U9R19_12585, partial [Bacteroidota bacterium]|nr:hypothetical protein [Bacteroidota bacterium]
ETKGAGYNFKFGAIIKPAQWVRFGGAIHFPTFYKLHDDYSDHLDASLTFDNGPAVSEAGEFDYELTTPFKAIGSAAVVVGKVAIFSFDYEYLDYTKARFRNGGEFELENGRIQDVYTAAHNLRGGMEMRFGPISLRGGYSYFGSPFQSGEINEDADYSILSGGIGINSNSFYIDFAYSQMLNSENYVLYFAQQPAISNIDYGRNQVMATIGFRF